MDGLTRAAATAAVAGLLGASGLLALMEAHAAEACLVIQAESEPHARASTLRWIEVGSGAVQRVSEPGYRLNALGYAAGQDLVYAVADGLAHGAHAVTIDGDGRTQDLGPIVRAGHRHPSWSPVTGATAGAIGGNSWYLLRNGTLYTVDLTPGERYLRVIRTVFLRPITLGIDVDDFAYHNGLLYGVSTTSRGKGAVVTLDPVSGRVAEAGGGRFPVAGTYGAVVLGRDGAFYATANRIGGRSVLYRLDRSGQLTEVRSAAPLSSSDAAGCLGAAEVPKPPAPPPPAPPRMDPPAPPAGPSVTPTPTSVTTPPANSPSAAAPQIPRVIRPTQAPAPDLPRPTRSQSPRERKAVAEAAQDDRTAVKRRWILTALILVLGGGAAARAVRRHR